MFTELLIKEQSVYFVSSFTKAFISMCFALLGFFVLFCFIILTNEIRLCVFQGHDSS